MKKYIGKLSKIICLTLCVALCVGHFPKVALPPVEAAPAVTADSIKKKEAEIAKKKEEKTSMQNSLSDLKKITKELESQKANLQSYIKQLDANLAIIEQNILDLMEQIADKEEEIILKEGQLAAALEREETQKVSLMACIRLVYETGVPGLVELLMRASSFGDFLNKADYAEKVVNYDHQLWKEYIEYRQYVELCKQELELEREILDQAKANVEIEQANLEELIAQKGVELVNYENDITNKEKVIAEYEQELKDQEAEIKELEAIVAAEKKAYEASLNALKYDGGMFKFPMASFTRVSSEYGWRVHPTLGVNQFHNGVDFAAPKGTAIYAAYDGEVVASAYSSTMGNYIMINHGSELYTIYMHASALYVKKGEKVIKGEKIAAVGSTGRSTGPHLHFTVRLKGEYVSPWDYLKKN